MTMDYADGNSQQDFYRDMESLAGRSKYQSLLFWLLSPAYSHDEYDIVFKNGPASTFSASRFENRQYSFLHNVLPVPCHSHNDYWRRTPLYAALGSGCISVEADVWLFDDDLFVGHSVKSLNSVSTLRSVYLDPLYRILEAANAESVIGGVATDGLQGVFAAYPTQTLVLLVDFKTEGPETYLKLHEQLQGLRDAGWLTHWNGTDRVERPLTVVISGYAPFDMIAHANTTYRDIFFDAPLTSLEADGDPATVDLSSDDSAASLSRWDPSMLRYKYNPSNSWNPHHPGSDLPGALGRGQAVATALGNFFKFWAYASTVIGAVIADQYLGRFKTIAIACGVYIVDFVILVATSTPAGIGSGAGFGGLIAAMVVIGMGTGSIKANVTPMCAEQYRPDSAYVKRLKSGEGVVVDPELTIVRMFNWFYWAVNVSALSPLITVNIEAHVSFWAAYLIPLVVIVICAVVFILISNKLYVKTPPHGSAFIDAVRIITIAVKEGGFDKAKPSSLQAQATLDKHRFAQSPNYTDKSVKDVQSSITACKLFLFLPLYFVCWIQIWNNLMSQAGTMALHGTRNDLLQNLDTIALVIFIPLLDWEFLISIVELQPVVADAPISRDIPVPSQV
ncbi:hypothetical protein KCU99_g6471, partial [Aureobasidium melanogenum]